LNGFYRVSNYPQDPHRIRFTDEAGKRLISLTNHFGPPVRTIAALYKQHWQVELFFKWIKQHLRIKRVLWRLRERGGDADLDRRLGLCAGGHDQKKRLNLEPSLHTMLQILFVTVFEKILRLKHIDGWIYVLETGVQS
jgi:hypothetical protein